MFHIVGRHQLLEDGRDSRNTTRRCSASTRPTWLAAFRAEKWTQLASQNERVAEAYHRRIRDLIETGRAFMASGAIESVKRTVCTRILASSNITINRCMTCSRVLRTPLARQCFWCGAKR